MHSKDKTLLDFNKSGIPLVEIVTNPEFESVEEAVEFSKKIQEIVRALGIGDVDMEKGQMRLEANISLRPDNSTDLPKYKVEIKNINSFKFMEKAVRAEIKRQEELFTKGETPIQENRGYDEDQDLTLPQREKEEAHDYRYFPEPDIPPMVFSTEYLEKLRSEVPQLPDQVKSSLVEEFGISEKNAAQIMSAGLSDKFRGLVEETNLGAERVANLLINRKELRDVSSEEFANATTRSFTTDQVELKTIANQVLQENSDAVINYKNGKTESMQFLVGQVMRKSAGKADPALVTQVLKKLLEVS
jgi:aspartyl-tRNA(Asn)/glutamyl-tRNA(Gln) amidotransferase subunit B